MTHVYVNHAVVRADNDPLVGISDCELLYDPLLNLLSVVVDDLAALGVAIYPVTEVGDV